LQLPRNSPASSRQPAKSLTVFLILAVDGKRSTVYPDRGSAQPVARTVTLDMPMNASV
jgi:hypothetical protein